MKIKWSSAGVWSKKKVVKQFYGHVSGVYACALHPELDLLVTEGRDATARVWDIRTRVQVHCLGGHSKTVESVACKADEPQIITGSHDKMIKTRDIRTGNCLQTLTHHKKCVRALVINPNEYTFASGGADKIRIRHFKENCKLRII